MDLSDQQPPRKSKAKAGVRTVVRVPRLTLQLGTPGPEGAAAVKAMIELGKLQKFGKRRGASELIRGRTRLMPAQVVLDSGAALMVALPDSVDRRDQAGNLITDIQAGKITAHVPISCSSTSLPPPACAPFEAGAFPRPTR